MSDMQQDTVNEAGQVAAGGLAQTLVRVIEDPFGSVIVGIVAPAAAVAMVVSGIYGLGVVY